MAMFGKRVAARVKKDERIAKSVLVPAVSTMVSDGDVDASELAQIANLCSFSPIFFDFSQKEVAGLVRTIIKEIAKNGHPATIEAAAHDLSPALRETALCFAMRVAFADGRIDDGEKNALSATGALMNIPKQVFSSITDVVVMMQRPATA